MADRFYFGPLSETNTDGITGFWAVISPGHYGRSITAAQESLGRLREQLTVVGASVGAAICDVTEHGDPTKLEIGASNFDKGVLRVMLRVQCKARRDELKAALRAAFFGEGIPDAY